MAETTKPALAWYQGACTAITLKSFDTAQPQAGKSEAITDPAFIAQVTGLLDQLPVEGDEFISMGPTRMIAADLTCGGKIETIQFFGESIKTPGTSFYSKPHPAEVQLYDLLRTHLGLPAPAKPKLREGMLPLPPAEQPLSWYSGSPCTAAKVTIYKHTNSRPPFAHEQATITDPALLRQITGLLDRLPTEGAKYKSWSADVPILHLQLTCGGETSEIEFYRGQIKTPATSFFAPSLPAEKELFELLTRQLPTGPLTTLKGWLGIG